MASLASEFADEIRSLDAAICAYVGTPGLEAIERISIKSRSAVATFEELACWMRTVDPQTQATLLALLNRAIEVLAKELTEKDAGYRYLERLRARRDRVASFRPAMLDDDCR